MIQLAKIDNLGQITLPDEVRKILDAEAGDTLAFELESDGRVLIRRLAPLDFEYLAAVASTLPEWNSMEDDEAYRDLSKT